MGERAYHLAVSGDVFRWMVDYGAHETLQRVSRLESLIQKLQLITEVMRVGSCLYGVLYTLACHLMKSTRS